MILATVSLKIASYCPRAQKCAKIMYLDRIRRSNVFLLPKQLSDAGPACQKAALNLRCELLLPQALKQHRKRDLLRTQWMTAEPDTLTSAKTSIVF